MEAPIVQSMESLPDDVVVQIIAAVTGLPLHSDGTIPPHITQLTAYRHAQRLVIAAKICLKWSQLMRPLLTILKSRAPYKIASNMPQNFNSANIEIRTENGQFNGIELKRSFLVTEPYNGLLFESDQLLWHRVGAMYENVIEQYKDRTFYKRRRNYHDIHLILYHDKPRTLSYQRYNYGQLDASYSGLYEHTEKSPYRATVKDNGTVYTVTQTEKTLEYRITKKGHLIESCNVCGDNKELVKYYRSHMVKLLILNTTLTTFFEDGAPEIVYENDTLTIYDNARQLVNKINMTGIRSITVYSNALGKNITLPEDL